MENQNLIYRKLEQFIKKFYTNELLRGTIFFVGIGLIYFLFTLFIEYFLWLKPAARTVLFWTFIAVEFFLLLRFILFPTFKLFKLQKGINYDDASKIIGNHFNEVGDKLTNFLQLSQIPDASELLLASIDQKADNLKPIPFANAINFGKNKKFLPLAIIPILFFAFFYLSGNSNFISQSLNRVVHYKEQFLPPAPFKFHLLNTNLQTEQNHDFLLKVKTVGKIVPENAMIFIANESYFMESNKPGEFQFVIPKPNENLEFHIEANDVSSQEYELTVVKVPSIANLEMILNFPIYLNKKAEIIKGTGNAVIPEGTRVTWSMNTVQTERVEWKDAINKYFFSKQDNQFLLSKQIFQNTDYQIFTSNEKVQNYEKLNYQISVVRDQYPTISVGNAPDSLKIDKNYVLGEVSDDYGLSKLQVVYYPKDKPNWAKRGTIAVKHDVYDHFVFAFPSTLPVEEGVSYEYYFEVFDNDALHHFKSSKSLVFSNRIATQSEKEDEQLKQQNENINSLQKSIRSQDKQLSDLDKIQKNNKEKDNLEFKDIQKINDFIKKQQKQEDLVKEYAEKMKENLDKFNSDNKDDLKKELDKRLENVTKEYDKNKNLLEELKQLNDKIKQEELTEKMDQFKQNAKNQSKSLEQLIELTKKYYVQKKAEQIKDKLKTLSEKENELSNKDKENTLDQQEQINNEFNSIQDELEKLVKENKELKKPLDIPLDKDLEKSINDDLNNASSALKKDKKESAKSKQKEAAKKMQSMSMKIDKQMEEGETNDIEEDVEMLRQILDNLLAYSFSQEDLMARFKGIKIGSPSYNKNLKIQQDLKLQFNHVDDSLFAMSLRNPKIGDEITKEIGNVHYNIDKSLEFLADSQIQRGVSFEQYATASANKLANFLSDALNNMQMSMSGSGVGKPKKGQGEGLQLPDIIKKQEGLGEKLKKGIQKGNKSGDDPKQQDGKEGKEGTGSTNGNSGSDGKGKKNSGKNQNGNTVEDGEQDAKTIMEIYKEQQELREALQIELNKKGLGLVGQNTLNQMKDIEKQLLNKGFKNETLHKILNVKQELLKLDKAMQEQGQEEKRQSEANKKAFRNTSLALPKNLQEYINSIEILNRQSVPLRPLFNQKAQIYFKKND